MVRAKFSVVSVEKRGDGDNVCYDIALLPVVSSEPGTENAQYWQATPAGSIKLTTVNAMAGAEFIQGEEYYVDFTPANKG